MNHFELYVGPVAVAHYAGKLRELGYNVTCEGTDKVYFDMSAADVIEAALMLEKQGMPDMRPRLLWRK